MADEAKSIEQALRDMQAVKAEHREILARVAQDAGMSPETRWALIEHLYDEEDEHLEELTELASNSPAAPPAAPTPSGLTVGSLRPQNKGPQAHGGGSVGSLRKI